MRRLLAASKLLKPFQSYVTSLNFLMLQELTDYNNEMLLYLDYCLAALAMLVYMGLPYRDYVNVYAALLGHYATTFHLAALLGLYRPTWAMPPLLAWLLPWPPGPTCTLPWRRYCRQLRQKRCDGNTNSTNAPTRPPCEPRLCASSSWVAHRTFDGLSFVFRSAFSTTRNRSHFRCEMHDASQVPSHIPDKQSQGDLKQIPLLCARFAQGIGHVDNPPQPCRVYSSSTNFVSYNRAAKAYGSSQRLAVLPTTTTLHFRTDAMNDTPSDVICRTAEAAPSATSTATLF